MKNEIKEEIEKLMKGCGHWSEGKVKGLTIQTQCGNTGFKDSVCLCNVCRDKIEELRTALRGKTK